MGEKTALRTGQGAGWRRLHGGLRHWHRRLVLVRIRNHGESDQDADDHQHFSTTAAGQHRDWREDRAGHLTTSSASSSLLSSICASRETGDLA